MGFTKSITAAANQNPSSKPHWLRKSALGLALGATVTVAASFAAVTHAEGDAATDHTSPVTKETVQGSGMPRNPAKKHWFEIGKASWYGKAFNGHRTANGERFDMMAWTCAHRTLPLGSWVKVTNLLNRKAIFLRVNDRGPVPESQVVDLSYAAARKIGISGLAKVRVEAIPADDPKLLDQLVASVRPTERAPWPVTLGWAR
jgi:rare lipoprotein A